MQIEDVGTSLKEERKRMRAKQIELSHDCLMSVIRTVFFFSHVVHDQIIIYTQKKPNNDIVMQVLICFVRLKIFFSQLSYKFILPPKVQWLK